MPEDFVAAVTRLTEEELPPKQVKVGGAVFHVVAAVLVLCKMLGESPAEPAR